MISRLPHELEETLRDNPVTSTLLDNWKRLDVPNCWLVAGAVVQSYWNSAHGYSPIHGISDADIVYFDPNDLSEESEANHAHRIGDVFHTIPVRFDVKNEARVHLWYEERFGYPIDAYTSAEAAMDTFPTTAGSIGIRQLGEDVECYAAFGFEDLLNLIVRPNKRQITRGIYAKKIARWRAIWPMLKIVEWEDA